MSDEKIKVAIVGAGGWGLQHARVFSQREDVDLCAVAGRTPEKTQARARQFDLRCYLDIDEMLDKEKPDLVSLSLPNKEHFAPTLKVIRAGFPLLVEKPLAFDLDEADTLLREAGQRGLFFAINFNHRYAKPVQMAHRAIGKGRLGEIVFATWRFGGEGASCPEHENLIETQCHGFDMLEFLCGPISSVAAQMTDHPDRMFSTMVLALRFACGAVGSIVGTYDSSYAYGDAHRVEINGTGARILIEDTVRRFSIQQVGNETAEVWGAGYFNDRDREFHRTFDNHLDALLEAFKSGREPPVHARTGRRALVLADAAIRSFESGRRIDVPPDPADG